MSNPVFKIKLKKLPIDSRNLIDLNKHKLKPTRKSKSVVDKYVSGLETKL